MDRVQLILEIEDYGRKNNIPIMCEDSIKIIQNIIIENNVKTILEIGTAIAYSTLCFASTANVETVTSIERDEERYKIALKNVKKCGMDNIELIFGDALDTIIDKKYDLIIIDAAKSQNMRFFNKYKNNLNRDGIIIIDNLEFHGYVGKSEEIKSRNLRQMVRKIEKFLDFLNNNTEFDVEYVEVGDRLGICKRKDV